jgi:hypothetical protein
VIIYNISSSRRDLKRGKGSLKTGFFLLLSSPICFSLTFTTSFAACVSGAVPKESCKGELTKTSTESLIKNLHVLQLSRLSCIQHSNGITSSFGLRQNDWFRAKRRRKRWIINENCCCLHARLDAQRSLKMITGRIIISLF